MGMDKETLEVSLRAGKRTLLIVWFACLAEPSIYALLPWVLSAGQVGVPDQSGASSWRWGAFLLAVFLVLVSLALQRFMLSDRQIKARLAVKRGGADASPLGSSSLSEAQLLGLVSHYRTSMLVVWALNGCLPIGGLMHLFTSGDSRTILVLSALAVVLNLLAYPQLSAFVERVRDLSYGGGEI
jgi:hypothetical protein